MVPESHVLVGLDGPVAPSGVWIGMGLAAYGVNLVVGMLARFAGARFGVWHHVLYAVVFATAVAAAVFAFHPGLLVTVAALAVFPKARPRSALHPLLAVIGLIGYLSTFFPSPW